MKDLEWFPPIPVPPAASARSVWAPVVVAVLFGLVLLWQGHPEPAIAIGAAVLLLALAFLFPPWRNITLRAMHWLAHTLNRILTVCFLWPFYVLVFGAVHLALAVTKVDLLGLRLDADQPSYWQPSAPERRRAKYYGRLFTLDPTRPKSSPWAWVAGFLALVLLLAVSSELILRIMGFGNPILYRVDPRIGYYPAPNQDVQRYGGRIHINGFGMRSGDVTAAKPAGTFRILMLGDSSLYGGSYLGQDQIYATRLEKLLNQESSLLPGRPQRVELLAMGVNGWGPQHELAYARDFGLFNADLVMVMGPPGDAYRALYGLAQLPFFVEGHRPSFAWEEFVVHLLWEYHLRLTGAGAGYDAGPQSSAVLHDGIAAWLALAELARAQGAKVDFEFLPNEQEVREGHASQSTLRVFNPLLADLSAQQIPFAFPLSFFRRELGVPKLYHDGAHLDSYGHAVYADFLRGRVRQLVAEN